MDNGLIDNLIKARMIALENGLREMILNTTKENIAYINQYYTSELGIHHINGVYGMRLKEVALPKDINFVITEDTERKTLNQIKSIVSNLLILPNNESKRKTLYLRKNTSRQDVYKAVLRIQELLGMSVISDDL